jgi:Protein of unknown function (DUF3309)
MSLGLILVIILVIFLLGGFSGRVGGYGYGFGRGGVGVLGTMKSAPLILMFVAAASPGVAADRQDLGQARWNESSHVNCETVRAYVDQVGLTQATALARAAGMTAGQEWRARRCLAKKI